MKKQMLKILGLTAVSVMVTVGSAMALPTLEDGFEWTSADFWTITDLTTDADGNSLYIDFSESASFDSYFGLFTVEDYTNPTSPLDVMFEVFDPTAEPIDFATVHFEVTATGVEVSLNGGTAVDFDSVFGFYFEVEDTGAIYYTASYLNTVQPGVDHILTAWDPDRYLTMIYLEDLPIVSLDRSEPDFNDMIVLGDDLQPVPEPATMLLFGTGLSGLAALRRRKRDA